MKNKKERILNTALELFAGDGYNATSTSKIAERADVSEGLIFRYFENKKGLLEAPMEEAQSRISKFFAPVIFEDDPRKAIRKFNLLPFTIDQSEYDFWKLQFKLKWEEEYNNLNKMKPLIDKLTWAFTELGYQEPEVEALLLNLLIDSISIGILRDDMEPSAAFQSFLLEKYGV